MRSRPRSSCAAGSTGQPRHRPRLRDAEQAARPGRLGRQAGRQSRTRRLDQPKTSLDHHDAASAASRWTRTKLSAYVGLPAELPEIARLFYVGRRHLISGPGEAMKTWLCLAAAVDEIRTGRGVIWADLDGMGPRDIAARLAAFGLS